MEPQKQRGKNKRRLLYLILLFILATIGLFLYAFSDYEAIGAVIFVVTLMLIIFFRNKKPIELGKNNAFGIKLGKSLLWGATFMFFLTAVLIGYYLFVGEINIEDNGIFGFILTISLTLLLLTMSVIFYIVLRYHSLTLFESSLKNLEDIPQRSRKIFKIFMMSGGIIFLGLFLSGVLLFINGFYTKGLTSISVAIILGFTFYRRNFTKKGIE